MGEKLAQRLDEILPQDVQRYLRAHGWRESRRVEETSSSWINPGMPEEPAILVPLKTSFRDYRVRMAEIVSTLARVEVRSLSAVATDLALQSADVLRVAIEAPDLRAGTIPLDRGVTLVQRARDMLVAAASSAIDARPFFSKKKPRGANEFVAKARFGQTFSGSFGIVIATVPTLTLEHFASNLVETPPFERKVVERLAFSLDAIRRHVEDRETRTADLRDLTGIVKTGVSANLCDAVSAITDGGRQLARFAFSLTPRLAANERMPTEVRILPGHDEIVTFLSSKLLEAAPKPAFQLLGTVVRLHREEFGASGEVTVLAPFFESFHHVLMELEPEDHDRAIEAYRAGLPVRCEGTLVHERRGYILRQVTTFEILPSDVSRPAP